MNSHKLISYPIFFPIPFRSLESPNHSNNQAVTTVNNSGSSTFKAFRLPKSAFVDDTRKMRINITETLIDNVISAIDNVPATGVATRSRLNAREAKFRRNVWTNDAYTFTLGHRSERKVNSVGFCARIFSGSYIIQHSKYHRRGPVS